MKGVEGEAPDAAVVSRRDGDCEKNPLGRFTATSNAVRLSAFGRRPVIATLGGPRTPPAASVLLTTFRTAPLGWPDVKGRYLLKVVAEHMLARPLFCPEPDKVAHPDLHTAWEYALYAIVHGALIDGIVIYVESFADADAYYAGMLDTFRSQPDFVRVFDARREAAARSSACHATLPRDQQRCSVGYAATVTPFTHAVDMVSGELTATHNELLTINGTSAVNSHRAAVELLYTRLATVGHYAGFDFDARKTCEHWAAIRAELLPIAKAATANGKEHVELIKREWTLVAKRRLECATATEGTASEPAAVELPTTSAPPPLPDKAWLSHVELASHYELNPENLRQRLNTWRKKHAAGEGWKEAPERRPREPKYLYRVGAVRSIAEDMMTETSSGETSG